MPADFDARWSILACERYHLKPAGGETYFGAFYAVQTMPLPERERLPARCLVVSNLALPPGPTDPAPMAALKSAFRAAFETIDPADLAVLTSFGFAPYNPRIVFDLKQYAEWRLPVEYIESGLLDRPGRFYRASAEQLAASDQADFREMVERVARALRERRLEVVLYLDRFDSNFFVAAAAATIAGARFAALELPGEWALPADQPVMARLRERGLETLDLAAVSPTAAIRAIQGCVGQARPLGAEKR